MHSAYPEGYHTSEDIKFGTAKLCVNHAAGSRLMPEEGNTVVCRLDARQNKQQVLGTATSF